MLQGRGPKTHAYTHSLEHNHHMFMKLANGKVHDEDSLHQRQHDVLGPGCSSAAAAVQ